MTKPEKATTSARDPIARPADVGGAQAHATGPLVINLCSSNTPMTLVRPDAAELARFTFFVSRRREEGRERFRLHMGYFATRAEAEQLLVVVREVYPAAWVGEAPGQNLRPEARNPRAPSVTAPAPAAPTPSVAPRAPAMAPLVARPAMPPVAARPATPPQRSTPVAKAPAAAPTAPAAAATAATAASALSPAPALVSVVRAAASPPSPAAPGIPRSNVREVMAELETAKPNAARPAPARPAAPAAKAAVPVPTRAELEFELLAGGQEQTDSQVLRILETRVAPDSPTPNARQADTTARDIPVHRPQDTMSWREIRDELKREAHVSFALQLVWSPIPIDPKTVPALAIFDAYTLYNVEVGRPGQKQYGLRLGFFSDAMSAKQVATYVRSEFLSVAVVPVTVGERDSAQRSGGIELARAPAPAGSSLKAEEITLINELTPPRGRPGATPLKQIDIASLANKPAAAAAKAAAAVPAKPARPSRPRGGGPRTLEETLEILGASQLSIDNGKGERLNIGSRSRNTNDKRTSTFSKLLDRLSTRLKP